MKRILIICPYPHDSAPGQRFRFEQYIDLLKAEGFEVTQSPFMSKSTWDLWYSNGRFITKGLRMMGGLLKRWGLLFGIRKYDAVFIHREVKPIGLPLLDYLICKRARYVLFDFDDAIWLKNFSESNRLFSFLKRYKTVKNLCAWSDMIVCGNDYLANYAKEVNKNVTVVPTTIDTEGYHNKLHTHENETIIIGWTGSHSTVRYLSSIYPVIKKLQEKYTFEFRVISDQMPDTDLSSLNFVKWNKKSEIDDLSKINIGIMPLEDDQWSLGKCGFKALQYMSLGIPAIASPVGVNTQIIDHEKNGFLCDTENEWMNALESLLQDRAKIKALGKAARKKIESHYSVKANSSNFIHLLSN